MINTITAAKIVRVMESWAPKSLAYDWDNVGLQVGTLNKEVSKVLVTLDVTEAVVDEAVKKGAELIIAHHPLFFKSLNQLDVESRRGKIIQKLLLHHITVYAAHTNLDVAKGGVSDMLADLIGLKNTSVLVEDKKERLVKLAVYVPDSHAETVRQALGEAGAGHIGNYSHCSFALKGEGSFQPGKESDPYLGTAEKLERVQETKIETIIKENETVKLLKVLFTVHPYEEPAYDLIPLQNEGDSIGAGRIGELAKELTVNELCKLIKENWNLSNMRVVGNINDQVKRVAILGGSGEGYISAAKARQADIYITGDLTFHHAQDAWQDGMKLIDAGHYAEKVMKLAVKRYLDSHIPESENVEIVVSDENTDPFQYI